MEDYYLVDAKQEYTSYLISTLAPSMYTGFKDIFEQSKKILNGNSVFKNFQILLSNVPNWNDHMLNREVNDITKETGCDWLDNLITAVFVSHSKILTSVKIGNYRPKNKKIDLKIPDTTSFIHQCYINAAREFYKNPLLFLEDTKMIKPDEILKNQQLSHSIIKESIMTTIRKLLPFRNILNEYLSLENNNNTIFIGNSSVGGSIAQNNIPAITLPPSEQPKQLENSINTKPQESIEKNLIDNSSLADSKDSKPLTKPILPIIEDVPLPDIKNKKMTNKIPVIPEESQSISTESSGEKEIKVVGKELNLFDMDINQLPEDELSLNVSVEIPHHTLKNKKIESLDSASLNKFVNNIKEEFDDKEDESINLDDLSFLEKVEKPVEKTVKNEEESINLSFLESFKNSKKENTKNEKESLEFDKDNLSFLEKEEKPVLKNVEPMIDLSNVVQTENQIVPYNAEKLKNNIITRKEINDMSESLNQKLTRKPSIKSIEIKQKEPDYSIDLEKIEKVLKEDGTIIEQSTIQSNSFPLKNITPVLKERSIDRSSKQTVTNNNNIKKISIKYNAKVPFRAPPKKKQQKGKTTLVDEAADDDSSEMIFK